MNQVDDIIKLLKDYMDFSYSDKEFFTLFEEKIKLLNDKNMPSWLKELIEDFKRIDDERFVEQTGNFISSTEFRYNISQVLKSL